ncbi:MAG: 30S ribosomal protein S6 [Clostridia bacterium]|nr:30S ribosomal protein S6 [Clostridia bacterium]MBQ3128074.1 30S ribosomal protein S6 [Clostridia bacterium]MBQ7043550.1 30S ribosomal protein S6 [Clostridia bacterium]
MAVGNYEAMLVFSVKESEDAAKALVEKFKALVEKNGTVESVEEWGKRKLAYAINYETEGYYALYNFSSEPEFPAELSRILNITDGVLRSLIIKK